MNEVPGIDSKAAAEMAALIERFARRYAADGFTHPRIAAAVVTARGWAGLDRPAFADNLGITVDEVEQAESGGVGADALPDQLAERLHQLGISLS